VQKGYKQKIGKMGEDTAVRFLLKKGYEILERNFRFRRGEIDIIAKKQGEIVFVEVKTTMKGGFGEPEDRVGSKKQYQIGQVAKGYLYSKEIYDVDCRFDVITVTGSNKVLHHIKDAFWLKE